MAEFFIGVIFSILPDKYMELFFVKMNSQSKSYVNYLFISAEFETDKNGPGKNLSVNFELQNHISVIDLN